MKCTFYVNTTKRNRRVLTALSVLLCIMLFQVFMVSTVALANPTFTAGLDTVSSQLAVLLKTTGVEATKTSNETGIPGKETEDASLNEEIAVEDVMVPGKSDPISQSAGKKLIFSDNNAMFSSRDTAPPIPPPDKTNLSVNENTLLAVVSNPGSGNTSPPANEITASESASAQNNAPKEPVPSPQTKKSSSISTPLVTGLAVALVAGVAVGSGGGSSSDSDSAVSSDPGTTSSQPSTSGTTTIKLADLVRIGDDPDYNGHHSDHFQVNTPSGISWTDSFSITNASNVKAAKFKYTVAGSMMGNIVYINGNEAGRLCNPGNTAYTVESCSLDISRFITTGSNSIKIQCIKLESDPTTPYDDIELYKLYIELTQ